MPIKVMNPNTGKSEEFMNEKENNEANQAITSSEWNSWEINNRNTNQGFMKPVNHMNSSVNKSLTSSDTTNAESCNSIIVNEISNTDFANAGSIRANHQRTESDLSLSDINECLKTLSMNPNNRFSNAADDFVNRPMPPGPPTRDNDKSRVSYPPSKQKLNIFENQYNIPETVNNDNRGFSGGDNSESQYNFDTNVNENKSDMQAAKEVERRMTDRPEGSHIDSRNSRAYSPHGQTGYASNEVYPPNTGYHREKTTPQKNLPYSGVLQTDNRFQSIPNKFSNYPEDASQYSGNNEVPYTGNNCGNDASRQQAYNMANRGYYQQQQLQHHQHHQQQQQHYQQQQQQHQFRPISGVNTEFEDEMYSNNNYGNDTPRGGNPNGLASVENLSPIVSGFDGFVYKVQFKRSHRNFLRSAGVDKPIRNGDFVIVEADRGEDLGVVCEIQPMPNFFREGGSLFAKDTKVSAWGDRRTGVKHIIRHALPQEYSLLPVKLAEESSIVEVCRDQCHVYLLPMLVVDAEYQFDRHKLTIFYESNSRRIDFRELVRDLFAIYKTRIWMEAVSYSFRPSDGATRALTTGVQSPLNFSSMGGTTGGSLSSGNLSGSFIPISPANSISASSATNEYGPRSVTASPAGLLGESIYPSIPNSPNSGSTSVDFSSPQRPIVPQGVSSYNSRHTANTPQGNYIDYSYPQTQGQPQYSRPLARNFQNNRNAGPFPHINPNGSQPSAFQPPPNSEYYNYDNSGNYQANQYPPHY